MRVKEVSLSLRNNPSILSFCSNEAEVHLITWINVNYDKAYMTTMTAQGGVNSHEAAMLSSQEV